MKIRSLEELQDKIDDELSWRKKELLDFRQLISSQDINERVLVRAGIAMLCAHFEGFIRTVSNYYVVYVSCKKVPINQIKSNFIALKIKNKITECGASRKTSVHITLLSKLSEMQSQFFEMNYSEDKRIIDTESNPKADVVCEIMTSLGLDFSVFESKRNYIDERLLKRRNEIVHGERIHYSRDEYDEIYDIILSIIEEYKSIIIVAAETEGYKIVM